MFLLSILALPHYISATLGGNDWFQHPSRVASENNGTNTKIHCQRFREAEQVIFYVNPEYEFRTQIPSFAVSVPLNYDTTNHMTVT